MIEVNNLSFGYGKKEVLDQVNVVIKEREITALIGSNGAGKSSLLSVITRLNKPTNGDVFIDGISLDKMSNNDLAKTIGVLRQKNYFNLKITVKELISFGRFPYSKGRLTKTDHVKIAEVITYLKLEHLENRFINELSGGELQRVLIGLVLAQDTKYIFLDEPLNNLDLKYALETMSLLTKLVRELDKTVVIVMHDINIASAFADKIIAMKDGKVIGSGTSEEMIDKNILDHVFDHNFCIAGVLGKKICVFHPEFDVNKLTDEEIQIINTTYDANIND